MSDGRLERWLARVESGLAPGEWADSTLEELRAHAEDRAAELVEGGAEPGEAMARAVEALGDPAVVAAGLAEARRPRLPWALFAAAGGVAGVGLLIQITSGSPNAALHACWLGLGLLVAVLAFRVRARTWRRAAPWWLTLGAAGAVAAHVLGRWSQGMAFLPAGPLTIDVVGAAPLLALLAAPALGRLRGGWPFVLAIAGAAAASAVARPGVGALWVVSLASVDLAGRPSPRLAWTWGATLAGVVTIIGLTASGVGPASEPSEAIVALTGLLGAGLLRGVRRTPAVWSRALLGGAGALMVTSAAWSLLGASGWTPLPTDGLALPLTSYGGTDLALWSAVLGIGSARLAYAHVERDETLSRSSPAS